MGGCEDGLHDCGQCDFKYTSMKDLMAHLKASPSHLPQCVPCGAKFVGFANYRHHVRKFHLKSSSEYVCAECGKVSKTEEQNTQHFSFVHKTEPDLYCNICGRECQNMFKLRKHTKICLKRDPIQTARERQTNEQVIPILAELVQTWTMEQLNAWKQKQLDDLAQKELAKTAKKSPYKRKLESKDPAQTPKKKKIGRPKKEVAKSEISVKPELDDSSKEEDFKESGEELLKKHEESSSESDNDNSADFEASFDNSGDFESHSYHNDSDGDFEDIKVEVQVKEEMPSDEDNDEADLESSPIKHDDVKEEAKDVKPESKVKKKRVKKVDGEMFPCPECNKQFSMQCIMQKHHQKVHVDLKSCPKCKEMVPDLKKHRLEQHPLMEKGSSLDHCKLPDGNYKCQEDECNEIFKNKKYLRNHIYNRHRERESPMKMCPLCAKEVKHLTTHMKSVHATGEPLHCSQCNATFKSAKYLRQHEKGVHGDKEGTDYTLKIPGEPLQCSQCSGTFKSTKYLKQHEKNVHGLGDRVNENMLKMCPICAKEVKHLNNHIRDTHPKDGEIFPCAECGIIFKSKRYLRHHVDAKHTLEGKVICPICNKLVSRHHVYTAHGDGLPFVCELCSKTFKTNHALSNHRNRIHSEKGVFPCPECGSVFDQAHKLYGHRYAVHSIVEAKCEFCGGNYKNRKLLQAHKRVSHPELLERSIKAQQMQAMNQYMTQNNSHHTPPPTSTFQHLQPSGIS